MSYLIGNLLGRAIISSVTESVSSKKMIKAFSNMQKPALTILLSLLCSEFAIAQSATQKAPWPDNIIITKRTLGKGGIHDVNAMDRAEAAAIAVCAQLGKLYEPGTLEKILAEKVFVVAETTYLAGRRKLVITESLMKGDEKGETCVGKYRVGWTYDYTGPGEAWTVVRSPRGVYSPTRPDRSSPTLVRTLEGAFQNRLRKFEGQWRREKYSEIEAHFGHRCGYPPNPADLPRPQGIGEYGALYDRAVTAAQNFHQGGPKLCYLIESPQHVGTGEKLVLQYKHPSRDYDEESGCYEFDGSKGSTKKECQPIVVDFQVNAAMPAGIFEKPQWARGVGTKF